MTSLCAVVQDGAVFHLKTAYDEGQAAHSPGLQLELGLLDEFHRDRRVQWIDSCTSDGPSPSSVLYPDRRPIQNVVVPVGGVAARAGTDALRRGLDGRRWACERARAARQAARRTFTRGKRLPDGSQPMA